jgi:uncharacterized protein (TIGR02145 family)
VERWHQCSPFEKQKSCAGKKKTNQSIFILKQLEKGSVFMKITKSICTGIAVLFFLISVTCTKNPASPVPDNNPGTVTDIDGNIYSTKRFGAQVWMLENLRVTKYNDGSLITLDTSTTSWDSATTPKYCYYNHMTNTDSIKKYGALYNWYVVNTGKLAPLGWHVPTHDEWVTLENYLIQNGYNWDGTTTENKVAKSMASQTDWYPYSTPGTVGCDLTKNNSCGFSAFPVGDCTRYGTFFDQGYAVYWWSATAGDVLGAWCRNLTFGSEAFGRSYNFKSCGFSVRLLMD